MELNAGLIQKWGLVPGHLGIGHPFLGCPPEEGSAEDEAVRNSSCPKVNLSASLTITVVAAMALIHAGHPAVTMSSLLDDRLQVPGFA